MSSVWLLNCLYNIQIYAIENYQKQRDHYETFLLNRKLHKIEHQLREMLEQELNEEPQSFDNSDLQMIQRYMSKQSINSSATPPNLDMPLFRRERKSEARLEKLKKKKLALKKEETVEVEPEEVAGRWLMLKATPSLLYRPETTLTNILSTLSTLMVILEDTPEFVRLSVSRVNESATCGVFDQQALKHGI